jgi:predicted amidohydrolase
VIGWIMKIKIALAQFNTKLGDVHANLQKHLELIEEAHQGADLIVFPELSLTGYALLDLAQKQPSAPTRMTRCSTNCWQPARH